VRPEWDIDRRSVASSLPCVLKRGGRRVLILLALDRPGDIPISLDEKLLFLARTWGHTPAAERKVACFSLLGEHAGVWLLLGAAESLSSSGERRSRWARATGAVAGTYAANTALKLVVRRVRPELPGLPPLTSTPTRFSFPSAHSSTSFAGALAYSRAGLPAAPLFALAVGLALSRLYLGVHYPSDVLAGALLGTAIAGVAT
jgi:membrane-associated phospholipid phosphatase